MNNNLSKMMIRLYAMDIAIEVLRHLAERHDTNTKISAIIAQKLEKMLEEIKEGDTK